MQSRYYYSRSMPFLQLFVITFISTILISGFILLLGLNRRILESQKMNFLDNEIRKKFGFKSTQKSSLNNFKNRIKHIKKSETTEDHCVSYNFVKAEKKKPTSYEPISLALHSTINYAFHIISHAKSWNDFISYSLYLYPGNESILFLLLELHSCYSEVKSKVSIHLVWNRGFFQKDCLNPNLMKTLQMLERMNINCSDFSIPKCIKDCCRNFLGIFFEDSKFRDLNFRDVFYGYNFWGFCNYKKIIMNLKSLPIPLMYYPINIMRNEARRGSATKIHLIADIETRFSQDFAKTVRNLTQNLLNKKLGKAVLIFRRFEMYSDIPFPKSPADVIDLMKDKKLFPFHWYFFKQGHEIPDLQKWFNYSISNSPIKYTNPTYFIPEWEPQFIMLDRDPYHLEFVPTRNNDHQTLVNHLCRAGYNFLVMSHVFNIHRGIKRDLTPIEMALSKLGRKKSSRVVRRFNIFLDKYYPRSLSDEKCQRITI